MLASSSAAGGLRMAVIGLVPGLTVEAANTAALGAGAKVVGSWSFKLAEKAMGEIEAQRPDMILLTGGTDGGDSATILHNARLLARSALSVPIVMAGNQVVSGEVRDILTNSWQGSPLRSQRHAAIGPARRGGRARRDPQAVHGPYHPREGT